MAKNTTSIRLEYLIAIGLSLSLCVPVHSSLHAETGGATGEDGALEGLSMEMAVSPHKEGAFVIGSTRSLPPGKNDQQAPVTAVAQQDASSKASSNDALVPEAANKDSQANEDHAEVSLLTVQQPPGKHNGAVEEKGPAQSNAEDASSHAREAKAEIKDRDEGALIGGFLIEPSVAPESSGNAAAKSVDAGSSKGSGEPEIKPSRSPNPGGNAFAVDAKASLANAVSPQPASTRGDPIKEKSATSSFLKSLNAHGELVHLSTSDNPMSPQLAAPIGLSEAVALSLKNNYGVLAARASASSSFYDTLSAYSEYMPQVKFNYNTGHEKSEPASINDEFGNRVVHSYHPRWDRNLVVTQPIIDLSIISDILLAHDHEGIADADQRDTCEGTAYDTANIYLKLIQSNLAVQLADQYKAYLDALAARMQERFKGGGATKADLERIQGRASLAESAKIDALGEYRSNLTEFARLTHVTPTAIRIPDTINPRLPDTIQVALEQALKTNPAYISSQKKVDAAADDRNKYAANLLPKVSVQYSKNQSWDAGGSAYGNPVDGIWPNQTTESMMVVASWAMNGGTAIASGIAGARKTDEMNYKMMDTRLRCQSARKRDPDRRAKRALTHFWCSWSYEAPMRRA